MSVRFLRNCLIVLMVASLPLPANSAGSKKPALQPKDSAFSRFVASLWPAAQLRGVRRETFDVAFRGIVFDPKVVDAATRQPEFSLPVWAYLKGMVSEARIAQGRNAETRVPVWLAKAQREYHVDPAVIMGIWGVESEFGAFTGQDNVVQSLASLAFVHSRGDYFRDELLDALTILQTGDVSPAKMKGSWAGAMGQTQFMPSSFLAYAIDFEGDGRRDIWTSAPDAIGSTACFLFAHGWKRDLPWGFEVKLPEGFTLSSSDSSGSIPLSAFQDRGVTRLDNRPWPTAGEGRLLILAGLPGPVFLVTSNFDVLKSYNPSTSYALAVALLGDAIVSGSDLKTNWPSGDPPLAVSQVKRLQAKLKALGYNVGDVDGKAGDILRSAVRAYQQQAGLVPDGYASAPLLEQVSLRKP